MNVVVINDDSNESLISKSRSKSRLGKAAGAEPAVQKRDETLQAVVALSTFPN